MSRPLPRERRPAAPASDEAESSLRFSVLNFGFLAAGLVSIGAGFFLLAGGSTVAAPLLLMLGFAVLVPLGIIL
jgi:hypothetical protein